MPPHSALQPAVACTSDHCLGLPPGYFVFGCHDGIVTSHDDQPFVGRQKGCIHCAPVRLGHGLPLTMCT